MIYALILIAAVGNLWAPAHSCDQDTEEQEAFSIRTAAEQFLSENYPSHASRMSLRIIRSSDVHHAEDQMRLMLPRERSVPRGHTRFEIQTYDASAGWERAGWLLTYISHHDSVVVPRRSLRSGDLVDSSDVEIAWMDVTSFHGEPLTAVMFLQKAASGSTVLVRPAREGRPLRTTDIRKPHLADTGSPVIMLYDRRGLEIKLRCHAREPGSLNEAVRIYCQDTGKMYRAEITGEENVRWLETL